VPAEDRERLQAFLRHLQWFVATGAERHIQELPDELGQDLLRLWSRQEERFDSAISYLGDQQIERDLVERGLTGAELAIKLEVYEITVRIYEERPTPTRYADALKAGDIPLDSLASVVPGLDAVKEAKELFEFLFSWGRGRIRRAWRRFRGR
jgi:hypothetical protein